MKTILYSALFMLLFSACTNSTDTKTEKKVRPPKLISSESILKTYGEGLYAQLEITEGDVLIKLEMEKAPLTVANFVALAEGDMPNTFRKKGEPYYDGLTFHRVISLANGNKLNEGGDFMIQGGDPLANGLGDPGYKFRNEINPALTHKKGVLAMANSGPNTNGSQFYITLSPRPDLDGTYNVFGKVMEGQEKAHRTLQGDKMYYIHIIRIGDAAKNFDAIKTFNILRFTNENS